MRFFSLFCLLVCTACGGSGGGVSTDPIPREPLVPIDPIQDPVLQGRATYTGSIGIQFFAPGSGDAVDLAGDLTLEVDFDNFDTAVSGAASGFRASGDSYTGNLLVNVGALDDSSGGLDFVTNINGSLLNGTTNFLVVGQMRGEVLGAGETATSGNITGQVLERGQTAALAGSFQAARLP